MQLANGLIYYILLWTVCVKLVDSNIIIRTEVEANFHKDTEEEPSVTLTTDEGTESKNSTIPVSEYFIILSILMLPL